MKDYDCVQFLQWALEELADYRTYLEASPGEWRMLDTLCPVTISRFYRDKAVFTALEQQLLPSLIRKAIDHGQNKLKVWSAGCASGEEAYTIALIWKLQLQQYFPGFQLEILATDLDPAMGKRISEACYPYSSIRYLPERWLHQAFLRQHNIYCLKPEYKHPIMFHTQDIRYNQPVDLFDLVLCRNLVFTYFSTKLQHSVTEQINKVMHPGGALVIGCHETLPENVRGFDVWYGPHRIYRKAAYW
ncbi:hypothetical protein MD588_19255 [Photobacterium sp. SDRW27]|uniref:CheR family methyltransferase n=1 Tax=Photobacterium obscurum TaxID=2829490 RepID=UPI0022434ED4|nr:CheR family methyltransferase [Photobacterium obscurum]MCW8330935.1 hypothetical protein [Photobacterium obscurum]